MSDNPQPSPEDIFKELRKIASDIAFSIYWVNNQSIVVTQEELRQMATEESREYYVEASALMVLEGEVYEGKAVLTGFSYKTGELDPDLNGWLPYLLWVASLELANKFKRIPSTVKAAIRYLKASRRPWR